MTKPNAQEKRTITTADLAKDASELVASIDAGGASYVVERDGKGAAALVPLHVLEDYERRRQRFSDAIEALWAQVADSDDAEVEAAIEEAIAEVRAERRVEREAKSGHAAA